MFDYAAPHSKRALVLHDTTPSSQGGLAGSAAFSGLAVPATVRAWLLGLQGLRQPHRGQPSSRDEIGEPPIGDPL